MHIININLVAYRQKCIVLNLEISIFFGEFYPNIC